MIQVINKKLKNKLAKKLRLLMFSVGIIVLVLFIALEFFAVKPMVEKILKIEVEQQLQIIIENIENNSINNEEMRNFSLFFDGGITIVDSENEGITFSNNKNTKEEWDILYRSILNKKIIEDLKSGTLVSEVIKFNNKKEILFVGESFKINNKDYYLYTYKILESTKNFNSMVKVQIFTFTFLLIIIIYTTSVIINKYFVVPIRKINHSVYKLANGEYVEVVVKGEDELSSLSSSVNILSKKLQEVEILRRELIANVSHELRSPLVLIRGYAELVKDVSWSNDEKREEQLNLIIDESIRMSKMVDDIMDYSQLQSGTIKTNKEDCDVIKLVKEEFFIAKKECELHNINIKLISNNIENKYAYVDALKISQVFRNLFNNAINHTKDNETIELILEEHNNDLKVEIRNVGETIPKEMIDKLFDKYYRVQHQSSRKKGTGIGLSIVKAVCELHDFEYGVTSENGLTKFYVIIK